MTFRKLLHIFFTNLMLRLINFVSHNEYAAIGTVVILELFEPIIMSILYWDSLT